MTQAFDTKELVAKLAAQGLPMAEAAAELAVKTVFEWCKESAAIHPNPIVKAAVPLAISVVEPLLAVEINKIDGNPAE